MELEKEKFMEEGMDLRFFLLRLWKSIWIVCVAALAGAAICAGGYMVYKELFPAAKTYMAETKYYIDFAEDSTGIGYGYYNDYTWNDWMKSDAILLYTMSLLPEGIDKERVEQAVEADIISDVRLLTITVKAAEEETVNQIMDATTKSLAHFPEGIKEIDRIHAIRSDRAKLVWADDLTKNWAWFGLVVGMVVSLLGVWLYCCMDTSLYLPKDMENRFGIPVLGVLYKAEEEEADLEDNRRELLANLSYLLRDKKTVGITSIGKVKRLETVAELVKTQTAAEPEVIPGEDKNSGIDRDYKVLREKDGVVLCVAYGAGDGKKIERVLSDFRKQDCKITGAILCDADKKFYRSYYFGRKQR